MIENNQEIQEYKEHNKIYIPQEEYDEYSIFYMKEDNIIIQNCENNVCYCKEYNPKYNIVSELYTCESNVAYATLEEEYISDNINDSLRITNDYIKEIGIISITFIGSILIYGLLFKRNSRRY